ncbi:MAG: hypothetical protein KGK44_00195 [Gammaproteobacteria bacterium]|nr:hypothetical protein [Gammaproteobacteria bacterium]
MQTSSLAVDAATDHHGHRFLIYMTLGANTLHDFLQKILLQLLRNGILPVLILVASAVCATTATPKLEAPHAVIKIAGGKQGIGFDDIGFMPTLDRISIPAGNTGELVLINPADGKITGSYRVTEPATGSGHETGTTSAVYGDGYIFASDRGMPSVAVLDARNGKTVQYVRLASGPDYIRYLESRHELWVTEPRTQQIQVFKLKTTPKLEITLYSDIAVKGGPESLVFDVQRNRAYTNLWKQNTAVIDLARQRQMATWYDGCKGPRGLALDAARGFLFVGCTEGKVQVLDVNHPGRILASADAGAGIDIISYNPNSRHLYVPGARSASMTIFKVSPTGTLHALAEYRTAEGAHCATNDLKGKVFVCDPHAGSILEINDH